MKAIVFMIMIMSTALVLGNSFADEGKTGNHDDDHGEMKSASSDEKMATTITSEKSEKQGHDDLSLDARIQALQETIEKLDARVAQLEAIKPTFTTFMPDFSERFHVMHVAGEEGDWAVAGHEVLELQRMVKIFQIIDPTKGKLMEAFIGANLHQLQEAIEHADAKTFNAALNATVQNCNNCHNAVEAPHIRVTLDMDEILSMRHSHKLQASKATPHTH